MRHDALESIAIRRTQLARVAISTDDVEQPRGRAGWRYNLRGHPRERRSVAVHRLDDGIFLRVDQCAAGRRPLAPESRHSKE